MSGERRKSEVRDRKSRRQGLMFMERAWTCSRSPGSIRLRERNEGKEIEVRMLQIERIVKKINYIESGRKGNSIANEKHFVFTRKVRQILVEDMRVVLEEWFGQSGGMILIPRML